MQMSKRFTIGFVALLLVTVGTAAMADPSDYGPTPPRLSLVEGPVSFWRTGATDWVAASLNTPLAAGDALYTGEAASVELQVGSRAFVRAGERTQLTLVDRQSDYLQFRVTEGRASFDLRTLPAGVVVEIDTPNAAFTVEHSGYYRLSVDGDTTLFITRRGGRATVVPAGGQALSVAPSEEVIVEGTETPSAETYVAPEPDAWDRWNYARTDDLLDAMSSRYLPPDVYGADDLDHYGDWRVVPDYGAVWVPAGMAAGWAPYSDGHWIWDPFYGWTWIDDAPWGWAPFHYGRWVFVSGFWAWAPGPRIVQSVYSPALVAFFSRGGVTAGFAAGAPALSWVALSWGEPVIPWWGGRGFVGRPWWGGWGGPRVVNNVVIQPTTNVNVEHITFRNAAVRNAVMAVGDSQFGHGPVRAAPLSASALATLRPVAGALPVKPTPTSLVAGPATSLRPSREALARPTVVLRAPTKPRLPWSESPQGGEPAKAAPTPQLRLVQPGEAKASRPAPFGQQAGPERAAPALPPHFEMPRPSTVAPAPSREGREPPAKILVPAAPPRIEEPSRPVIRAAPVPRPMESPRETPRVMTPPREMPRREERRDETIGRPPAAAQIRQEEIRALPGVPANRMVPPRHPEPKEGQKERR